MDINSGRIRLMKKFDIKSENSNEDIEDFAESTMNELLEWYGYENRHKEKLKIACSSQNGNVSSDSDSPKNSGSCDWCAHTVDDNKAISSAGAVFCSEMCFSQSRRANFKKNKTCDWCKHVRHTVSYVDFQDGASQLQFCSDKCLNQYKMHIFCRETRAHLEMHPHVPEDGKSSGVLITPDLWLKNCTQADNMSTSPSSCFQSSKENTQSSPLPLISIVHPSKLMDQKQESSNFHKRQKVASCIHKKKRKRIQHPDGCSITSEISSWNDCPQDLRIKTNNLEEAKKGKGGLADDFRLPQNCSELYRKFCDYPVLPPPPSTLPGSSVPPVTVLVPYPIMIPVPLPIPIPFDSSLLKNGGKSSTSDSQNSPKTKDCQNVGNNISEDSRKLLDLSCKRDFGKLTTEETTSEELDERVSGKEKQDESFPETVEKDVTKAQKIRLRSLRKRRKLMEGKKKSLQLKCKRLVSI